jgi:transcription initiation factor TFIID subunit 5
MAVGGEDSSIQLWNLFPQTGSNRFSSADNDRLDDNPVSRVGLACRRSDSPILDSHPSSNNISSSDTFSRNNCMMRGHSGPVYGLAFIPGTNYLVSCGEDTTMRAWDYTMGVNKALYRGHSYPIWSVDSDRLGLNIATGKSAQRVKCHSTGKYYFHLISRKAFLLFLFLRCPTWRYKMS